jgi:carboxymethylenebutenolidase
MKTVNLCLVLLLVLLAPALAAAQVAETAKVQSGDVDVTSGGKAYVSYLAAPSEGGPYPGVILIHSFRGLEEGYRTMADQLAGRGFVVLAVGWQTFEESPADASVEQLLEDSVEFLKTRDDVDATKLGLTGFCAGGRYTMLFLPQLDAFKAGVAWYGFPYRGETEPANLIDELASPMLIIHGTADEPSPIAEIYRYATALAEAGKNFELKVYQGEPHGFMLAEGKMRQDEVASDAFEQMVSFFQRKLS